jgi:prepilin-type N-terminal cleavage/methylation domain-containing protein
MLKNNKTQKGFTIIEVLIVLAIAGLILLIVFLAVALQRNSRNTGRKNDISRLGGAATEYVSNNNGTLPSGAAAATSIAKSAGTLGQYDFVTTPANFTVTAAPATITNVDQVHIATGSVCTTAGAASTTGATKRQMVIQYAVETGGGGTTSVCTEI